MKYDDNFEKVMDYVFNSEGGYVNHKHDRGGATNYGLPKLHTMRGGNKRDYPYKM